MILFLDSASTALTRRAKPVKLVCGRAPFLIGKEFFLPEADSMNRREKVADPAKPRPQDLLRKMISSGKSVDSKAKNK